jgi:hypothetical protein
MEKSELHGSLDEHPLSFLLFDLWTHSRDGRLTLTKDNQEKIFHFVEGKIAVDSEALEDGSFRRFFSELDSVDKSLLDQIASSAEQQNISWIKACLHLEVMTPRELWIHIQNCSLSGLLSWFDSAVGTYTFNPSHPVDKTSIYCLLPTLDVILQGTRKMRNLELIHSHLPDKDSDLLALFPRHMSQLELLPHENYLLQLISCLQSVKDVYEKSELGLKETERSLYLLLSLGLFSLSIPKRERETKQSLSPGELDRVILVFNRKCAHIFKYIGKEIGPVSINILEKALEESKARLSPLLHNAKLLADGRIELHALPIAGSNLSSVESQRDLLTGLNEILVAEVLAVKKILGEEHETVLVKNLKKIDT